MVSLITLLLKLIHQNFALSKLNTRGGFKLLTQITCSDLQIPSFPSSLRMRTQHTAVYDHRGHLGEKYMEMLTKKFHTMQNWVEISCTVWITCLV